MKKNILKTWVLQFTIVLQKCFHFLSQIEFFAQVNISFIQCTQSPA